MAEGDSGGDLGNWSDLFIEEWGTIDLLVGPYSHNPWPVTRGA